MNQNNPAVDAAFQLLDQIERKEKEEPVDKLPFPLICNCGFNTMYSAAAVKHLRDYHPEEETVTTTPDCGCRVETVWDGDNYVGARITYCPVHAAAPVMLKALKRAWVLVHAPHPPADTGSCQWTSCKHIGAAIAQAQQVAS